MGYQPIWDIEVDYILETDSGKEVTDMLENIFRHKLVLTHFVAHGPGAGSAILTLRGTARQIMHWIKDDYDPTFTEHDVGADFWLAVKATFDPKCIA